MHPTDWALLSLPLLFIAGIVAYSNRFTHTVADFLSGGRCAERYLLAVAFNTGAIVYVAIFETIGKAGFVLNWWGYFTPIIILLVSIYGFVSYRMRETRALTLAQFFELRYSKRFRVFAGILGAIAGLACDGIIAAVEARFFVYFLDLPQTVTFASLTLDTYVLVMGLILIVTGFISLYGGFVSVMIIDCTEGILSQLFYLFLIYTLLTTFHWSQITESLGHRPAGQSLFNPFDAFHVEDFNIWFSIMTVLLAVYSTGVWRNSNGNATAPLNAHEARMGILLGKWRDIGRTEVILLLAICGMTYLAHPDFAAGASYVHQQLAQISQDQIREQMQIPLAVAHMLPPIVKDTFCALMLMEMFAGTTNRSQSWSSIVIQDIIVPLRKTPFTPKRQLFLLKVAVVGVLLYFFVFGALFRQTQYIIMWFTIASAIFVGGAGSVIIGGLYWQRGTTTAAWSSLITGSSLAVIGILLEEIYGKAFPLNGVQVHFFAALTAITVYIVVSLRTSTPQGYDMDRMLHRGKYAALKELTGDATHEYQKPNLLMRAIGINRDFSRGDKIIAVGIFSWTLLWLVVFLVGTAWNFTAPWSLPTWFAYWHFTAITIPVAITLVTTLWFTWGGVRDIIRLYHRLKRERSNDLDNGMVIGHRNADELALEETKR